MKIAVCFLFAVLLHASQTEASAAFKHYPLVYNFYDVLAQASCTAKATTYHRIWAIRRSCSGSLTCSQVCSQLTLTCFHTYHMYKYPAILEENSDVQTEEGVPGLSVFNYDDVNSNNGCDWVAGHCGPDYCCCRGPYNALR